MTRREEALKRLERWRSPEAKERDALKKMPFHRLAMIALDPNTRQLRTGSQYRLAVEEYKRRAELLPEHDLIARDTRSEIVCIR